MKKTILAIAALALATAPFGRAQDVEASPTTPDSTTSEVTATAPPEESATPAPERSAAPAAEKSAAPAVAKSSTETKKATAAMSAKPATKPAASAAAAAPMKKMSVDAALKDMENRWEASYMNHVTTGAQAMIASDFVGIYWDGKVMSKSSSLSMMKKDKDTYKSAKNESLKVHSFGPNIAVVVGTAREKGTTKDGKAFDRTFRFTDTWVERNGQWQCVASQVMKLKG